MRLGSGSRGTAGDAGRYATLDGIRAFAVLTVFAFHLFAYPKASWNPFRPAGGFLSLDVFYVLSGFFITSLLLGELDKRGRISLRSFYARRALRLFPGLAVLLVVTLVASLIWRHQFWSHLTLVGFPFVVFYAGNWFVAFSSAHEPLGLLGQTWSLAVEEQFYLLWPAILILVTKHFSDRRRIAQALVAVAGAEMVYRFAAIEFLGWSARDRIYFGSDTHSDGLILGCALAFSLSSRAGRPFAARTRRIVSVAAVVATVALVAMAMRLSYVRPVSVWFGIPAASICTVVLVLNLVTTPVRALERILGWGPVVWVGKRSYGLYLWQATITMALSGIDFGISYDKVAVGEVAMTFVVAALSYRFVELPFLRRKRTYERAGPEPSPSSAPVAPS